MKDYHTIDATRKRLLAKRPDPVARIEILDALPQDQDAPTISLRNDYRDTVASLMYRCRYEIKETYTPQDVLRSLEAVGFDQMPASLVEWDNYRRTPHPGFCENIPDVELKKDGTVRHKLTDASTIAPVWIEANNHTGFELRVFMRKDGKTYEVTLDPACDKQNTVRATARRIEYRGGWRYDRAGSKLEFPQEWHGHPHATINEHTYCYPTTDQGLNAALYFTPHDEQDEWPMLASDFVYSLFPTK